MPTAVAPRYTAHFTHKEQRVLRSELRTNTITVPVGTSSNFPSDARMTCKVSPSRGIFAFFSLDRGCVLLMMHFCNRCSLTVTLSTSDDRIGIGEQSTTTLFLLGSGEWEMPYCIITPCIHVCTYICTPVLIATKRGVHTQERTQYFVVHSLHPSPRQQAHMKVQCHEIAVKAFLLSLLFYCRLIVLTYCVYNIFNYPTVLGHNITLLLYSNVNVTFICFTQCLTYSLLHLGSINIRTRDNVFILHYQCALHSNICIMYMFVLYIILLLPIVYKLYSQMCIVAINSNDSYMNT